MVQQQAVACDGLLLCKLCECLLKQFREVWGGVRNIRNVDIGAEGIPVSAENHSRTRDYQQSLVSLQKGTVVIWTRSIVSRRMPRWDQ